MQALLDEEAKAVAHLERTGQAAWLDAVQKRIDGLQAEDGEASHVLVRAAAQAHKRFREDKEARIRCAVVAETHYDAWHATAEQRKAARGDALVRRVDAADEDVLEVEDLEAWDPDDSGLLALAPPLAAGNGAVRLEEHQYEGVDFLVKRASADGKGAILAFAMGLGKTITALAAIERLAKPELHVLVLAPVSLLAQWGDDHAKGGFAYPCHPPVYGSADLADKVDGWVAEGGVLILSLEVLVNATRRGVEARTRIAEHTDLIVVDEVHKLTNLDSLRTKAVRKLRCPVWGLTGTPVNNSPMDFYHLAQLVDPSVLAGVRDATDFRKRFATPIERAQFFDATPEVQQLGRERTAVLRTLLQPVVRHKSSKVLQDRALVPPKREYALVYGGHDAKARAALAAADEGNYLQAQTIVDRTLRRTKVRLVDALVAAMWAAQQDDEPPPAALIFSEHPETLEAIEAALGARGRRCAMITGTVAATARPRILHAFRTGAVDVLLLSVRAGAEGLNCQRANYVVLADPSENPTRDMQAVGRAWRLGQTREVTVIRLAAEDTVDCRVLWRGVVKRSMAHSLLHTDHVTPQLSRADATSNTACHEVLQPVVKNDSTPTLLRDLATTLPATLTTTLGWADFDAFFAETEDADVDMAAALNAHHVEANKHERTFKTADGAKVRVPPGALVVGGATLVPPPIPEVRCEAKSTRIVCAPKESYAALAKAFADPRMQVEVRAAGADDDAGRSTTLAAESFSLRIPRGADQEHHAIQCRTRIVDGDGTVGPWSALSAPFVLRDD